MDLPVNQFKRAIASGKTPVGTWLSSGSPATAEALGCAGFDFLVVDTEHTPIDVPQMTEILRAIAGTPAQAVVRPPWNDMVMVKRAARCRRADAAAAVRAGRERGEARGRVHALSAGGRARRRRHASRQPLRHGAQLPEERGRARSA